MGVERFDAWKTCLCCGEARVRECIHVTTLRESDRHIVASFHLSSFVIL